MRFLHLQWKRQKGVKLEVWVDFLEWRRRTIACLTCFSGRTIIPIWEREEPEWQFMEKKGLTVPYIILRTRLSVPNLIKM